MFEESQNLNDSEKVPNYVLESYKGQLSISAIGDALSKLETFKFQKTGVLKVKQLLNNIDVNIALSSGIIAELLTTAMNNFLTQGVFSKNDTIASGTQLEKGRPNIYTVPNCKPVSILKTFSKICEMVIKNQITQYF